MKTLLYVIWFAIPGFFFLMALWGKLETTSGKNKRDDIRDFFYQGLFVLGCVFAAVLIDTYILPQLVAAFAPEQLPLGFFEVLLLPAILLLAAKLFGPSQEIRIKKAPHPTESRKRRR